MKLLHDFLKEYDDAGLFTFNKVNYRQGSRITCPFGLDEGYSIQPDGSIVFDTVRVHTGVDRSGIYNKNGQSIRNVVYAPFNFNRSASIYYGPKISYGYLIQLFNDDYGFEMRIAHMNPDTDIIPEVRLALERKQPIARDTFLGKAGNFGISGGLHTHTEFISQGMTCPVFDDLLSRKYGADVNSEYTDIQLLMQYQNKSKWVGKPMSVIKENFVELKQQKNISFLNKYKFKYVDPSTKEPRTRYSSEFLFNGM